MRFFKPVLGMLAVVLLLLSRAAASAGIDELPPCAVSAVCILIFSYTQLTWA